MAKSRYPSFRSKLDQLCFEMEAKMQNYLTFDAKQNRFYGKVLFLGINRYINGNPTFINWDIIYLYRSLIYRGLEARIHDPHIRGSEALSMGLWLGRQSKDETWSHSYDVLILSCPHLFYVKNMGQIGHLLNPDKACGLIDLYGMYAKIAQVGNNISIINMKAASERAELMGGIDLGLPLKRLN